MAAKAAGLRVAFADVCAGLYLSIITCGPSFILLGDLREKQRDPHASPGREPGAEK